MVEMLESISKTRPEAIRFDGKTRWFVKTEGFYFSGEREACSDIEMETPDGKVALVQVPNHVHQNNLRSAIQRAWDMAASKRDMAERALDALKGVLK